MIKLKNSLVFIIACMTMVLMVGCDLKLTQDFCMKQGEGEFLYMQECVEWNEIPVEHQEGVILSVALELAEEHDISLEEALHLMNEAMKATE